MPKRTFNWYVLPRDKSAIYPYDTKTLTYPAKNDVEYSLWNIRYLYMGIANTPYIQYFTETHKNNIMEEDIPLYKEITIHDYLCGIEYIKKLHDPIESTDRKAYNDTLDVLEWIGNYINDDSAVIVFEDSRG